jgi:hypothetical protein
MLRLLLGFLPLSSSVDGHSLEVLYVVKIVNLYLQRDILQKDDTDPDGAEMSNRNAARFACSRCWLSCT